MNIRGAAQELRPGAVIELYVLDISQFGAPIVRFHAGTNKIDGDVIWQGAVYQRFPVQATGFEWKSQGTLPRPTLAVSNITSIISAMCRTYDDMVGAKVIRRRTLARYLDAVNFPAGNPSADPNEAFPDDVFFINCKTREDMEVIEFELATAFDVEGVQLPRRQVIRNACPWKYRGDGCGYAGPAINAGDTCDKSLADCKAHFGVHAWLPFGAFPGAGAYR
ncbi:phage minor tail protein L [Paraburkholderia sp. EG287A]|uniref:phage minor tail protein L n=1 Tax=unclassified Paraburkholderia TaxID=2615204 RepID=UPI0034D285E8